jgi:hypothetical protein
MDFTFARAEHLELQVALASQPSTQDALVRLLLGAALPSLAATMAGASAALDGSSSADAARLQKQTFELVIMLSVLLDHGGLQPAVRRHLDTHGRGSALRCAVQVLNAVPLRCPNGERLSDYCGLLIGAMDMTAMLANSTEPIGDRGLTTEHRACAWELLRQLPRLAALLRAVAADAQQRPDVAQLRIAQHHMVAHMANLIRGQAELVGVRSGIRSVAEASEWAVATEAALGLLPLLDELDAGWDAPPSGSPPRLGVMDSHAASMALNIISGLLFGGLSSAKMLWSGLDMQQRAEEAARTGVFDALVRLHDRVCRLAFWLPARSSPGLLPDGCLELPQVMLQALFLLMWHISCCAEVGASEGVERRQGRCEGLWQACGALHPTLAAMCVATVAIVFLLPQARLGSPMHAGGKSCERRCPPTWLPCISALRRVPRWPARGVRHPSRPSRAWTACMQW